MKAQISITIEEKHPTKTQARRTEAISHKSTAITEKGGEEGRAPIL